jgi:hypothetical protein
MANLCLKSSRSTEGFQAHVALRRSALVGRPPFVTKEKLVAEGGVAGEVIRVQRSRLQRLLDAIGTDESRDASPEQCRGRHAALVLAQLWG